MRASAIIRNIWARGGTNVHSARIAVLLAAVDAVVRSTRVTLTGVGRALDDTTAPKHRIKRIDRMLGNAGVQRAMPTLQGAVARRLLRREPHPVVLLDWSQLAGNWWMLCAAIPFGGRALPIYSEVHPKELVNDRYVHNRFLDVLAGLLADSSRPIIVADAGFRTPFFNACLERGIDFVIRIRGVGYMWRYRAPRLRLADAFEKATRWAQCLGDWVPYGTRRDNDYRMVLGPRPSCMTTSDDYARRRAAEPWLLATSLKRRTPTQIVSIYALRMQIEETFRDAKSPRFGWSLEHTLSQSAERLNVLVAVAGLALIAAALIGAAAERNNLHLRMQANTTRNRRVLSVVNVGVSILRERCCAISVADVMAAVSVATEVLTALRHRRPHQLRLPFPRVFFARSG